MTIVVPDKATVKTARVVIIRAEAHHRCSRRDRFGPDIDG